MSATNRAGERVKDDFYPTPAWCTQLLLDQLVIPDAKYLPSGWFLEPCYGSGAIADMVPVPDDRKAWCELSEGADYLTTDVPADTVGLIITNPPFLYTLPFVEKSLAESPCVFYLLPLNILGSGERADFWTQHPPDYLFPLARRPAFVATCKGDRARRIKACGRRYQLTDNVKVCGTCGCKVGPGTDAANYGWFGWSRPHPLNLTKVKEGPTIRILV